MPSALIDTGVLLDYLNGDARARQALESVAHRSISVVTWLEVMTQCPQALLEPTRSYLRSFERLSISESIADEAARLMRERPAMSPQRALTWACAHVNQLRFLTADPSHVTTADTMVVVPYRSGARLRLRSASRL